MKRLNQLLRKDSCCCIMKNNINFLNAVTERNILKDFECFMISIAAINSEK